MTTSIDRTPRKDCWTTMSVRHEYEAAQKRLAREEAKVGTGHHSRGFSGGNKRKAAFEKPPVGTRTYERTTEGFTPPPTIMKEARGRESFFGAGDGI